MSKDTIRLINNGADDNQVRVIDLNNEEQKGILLLEVLGVEYYSSTQLMDAMRFVNKLMSYGETFRSILTDLSLIMGNGEQFYQINLHES